MVKVYRCRFVNCAIPDPHSIFPPPISSLHFIHVSALPIPLLPLPFPSFTLTSLLQSLPSPYLSPIPSSHILPITSFIILLFVSSFHDHHSLAACLPSLVSPSESDSTRHGKGRELAACVAKAKLPLLR